MKALRIFLLILIIIGIALLCTQKKWVPIVVNKIIAHENASTGPGAPVLQSTSTFKDGRQCYTYSHEATADAPYAVSEFIDMTIQGSTVAGTKKGTQNGPDMTNGYTGTLKGTIDNGTVTALFSYTVEGAHNTEKELYRASDTGIEKIRYPLVEEKGILVPDNTKEFSILKYARVGCTASN